MWAIILSAFLLGILGSLHCIGMCGPFVMSMPFQKVRRKKLLFANMNYHIGKTSTYALLGLLAGSIGQSFALFKWQQILSILSGVLLLFITFFPTIKKHIQLPKLIQQSFSKLFSSVSIKPDLKYFFMLGSLNGLLPCGLIYAALTGAIVTISPLHGMLFMICFGLGTIPSLTTVILFQHTITLRLRKYVFRSSYYISIAIGILLIIRGFNLGIPYISPHSNQATHKIDCCHRGK